MHKKNKNYWTFMFKYTNIELTVKRNKKQEGNKRMKGNVIVGQSGGPTAAINASLAGVYRTAKDRGANKVYGMLHGIQGLLKEKYIDLSDHIKTELDAELLKRTPAAFLGSCRYKLPNNMDAPVYGLLFEKFALLDIGACFSVNNMLRAKCYEQRMEKGLSFLEFNYMIMQSYDFYYMFQHYGCNMQFGGNDQWSNMLGGTELIRKKLGKDAHAMTITLLLNSEGNKMGKTAKGAVWLDPNKTSPFEFFQYWRNIDDADVLKCIRMLTFLPLEEIDKMSTWEGSQLNEAKEILAYELTKLVHGQEEADKAKAASKALFAGSGDTEHMPTTELTNDDFGGGSIDVLTLLVKCGLAASKGEARRLVQQGGVSVNDEKVAAIETTFGCEQFTGDGVIIKKGKKVFHKVT